MWMMNFSEYNFELIYNDIKYNLCVIMGSEKLFYFYINGGFIEVEVFVL